VAAGATSVDCEAPNALCDGRGCPKLCKGGLADTTGMLAVGAGASTIRELGGGECGVGELSAAAPTCGTRLSAGEDPPPFTALSVASAATYMGSAGAAANAAAGVASDVEAGAEAGAAVGVAAAAVIGAAPPAAGCRLNGSFFSLDMPAAIALLRLVDDSDVRLLDACLTEAVPAVSSSGRRLCYLLVAALPCVAVLRATFYLLPFRSMADFQPFRPNSTYPTRTCRLRY
jgi:hypothetical protein